jgi:hypothetical protein
MNKAFGQDSVTPSRNALPSSLDFVAPSLSVTPSGLDFVAPSFSPHRRIRLSFLEIFENLGEFLMSLCTQRRALVAALRRALHVPRSRRRYKRLVTRAKVLQDRGVSRGQTSDFLEVSIQSVRPRFQYRNIIHITLTTSQNFIFSLFCAST